MEELLQKLQDVHGLTLEQSHGILNTITNYIKEKFPMVAGAVDNIFSPGNAATTSATQATDSSVKDGGSFLDKVSNYIPGTAGEHIEELAKNKLSGMFGEDV